MSSAPPTSLANTTTLSNGVVMPLVGFGCAGRLGRAPLTQAIHAGYTLFDTSQAQEWYLEEELVRFENFCHAVALADTQDVAGAQQQQPRVHDGGSTA